MGCNCGRAAGLFRGSYSRPSLGEVTAPSAGSIPGVTTSDGTEKRPSLLSRLSTADDKKDAEK